MTYKIVIVSVICLVAVSLFVACGEPASPEDSCREMVEHFFNELDDGNWVNAQNYVASGDLPEIWMQEGIELESISIEIISNREAVVNISVKFLNEIIQSRYTCVQVGNNWKMEI